MKWLQFCILFLILFVLAGCGTNPPPPVVISYIAVLPPDRLLIDCPVISPPEKALYMSMSLGDREGELTEHGIKQNGELTKCHLTSAELRSWKVEQKMLYKNIKE